MSEQSTLSSRRQAPARQRSSSSEPASLRRPARADRAQATRHLPHNRLLCQSDCRGGNSAGSKFPMVSHVLIEPGSRAADDAFLNAMTIPMRDKLLRHLAEGILFGAAAVLARTQLWSHAVQPDSFFGGDFVSYRLAASALMATGSPDHPRLLEGPLIHSTANLPAGYVYPPASLC